MKQARELTEQAGNLMIGDKGVTLSRLPTASKGEKKMKEGAHRLRVLIWRLICLLTVIGLLASLVTVQGASAGEYDPQRAGNPLRVAAYILHPVGVLIDYGLMRPCFYVVKREPFSTIFGYVPPPGIDDSDEEER